MGALKKSQASETYRPDPARAHLERTMRQGSRLFRRNLTSHYRRYRFYSMLGAIVSMFGLSLHSSLLFFGGIAVTLLFLPWAVSLYILLERVMSQRIDVSETGVRIERRGGSRDEFLFGDVEKVVIRLSPLGPLMKSLGLRCWLEMKDGRKFTVGHWERPDYILDLLAHARPDLASTPDFERARNFLVVISHFRVRFAERTVSNWRGIFLMTVRTSLTSGLVLVLMGGVFGQWARWTNHQVFDAVMVAAVGAFLIWELWAQGVDFILQREKSLELALDSTQVRRNILAETKLTVQMNRFQIPYAVVAAVVVSLVAVALI